MEHRNFTSVKTKQQLLIIFPESLSFSLISRLLDTLQLVLFFYLLPFPRYRVLKIQNWRRGYAFVGGAISKFFLHSTQVWQLQIASKASSKNIHK